MDYFHHNNLWYLTFVLLFVKLTVLQLTLEMNYDFQFLIQG